MRKSHNIFDSFEFTYKLDLHFGLEKVINLLDLYLPAAYDCLFLKIIIIINSSRIVVYTLF